MISISETFGRFSSLLCLSLLHFFWQAVAIAWLRRWWVLFCGDARLRRNIRASSWVGSSSGRFRRDIDLASDNASARD